MYQIISNITLSPPVLTIKFLKLNNKFNIGNIKCYLKYFVFMQSFIILSIINVSFDVSVFELFLIHI